MKKEESFFLKNKNGQLTIFVIVGLVLVTGILAFLFFRGDIRIPIGGSQEANPRIFLESCIKDSVRESASKFAVHGGYVDEPLSTEYQFLGEEYINYTYLCYTQLNFARCINQKPLLVKDFPENIKNDISEEFETCFDDMVLSFQNKGYEVNSNLRSFDINLKPNRIVLETDSEVTLTKNDETKTDEDFEAVISSKMHELLNTAQEIVNQEARSCSFDISSFILTYPEYGIERKVTEDSSLVYRLTNKETLEEFRFAVRGCVISNEI